MVPGARRGDERKEVALVDRHDVLLFAIHMHDAVQPALHRHWRLKQGGST
jgi:hypothetical protein